MARLWMISRRLISQLFLPAVFLVWLANEHRNSLVFSEPDAQRN